MQYNNFFTDCISECSIAFGLSLYMISDNLISSRQKVPITQGFPAASTKICVYASIKHAHTHITACVRGFEPPTFWSVAKRSIQLS